MINTYLFYRQWTDYTCGPTVLRICVKAFLDISLSYVKSETLCETNEDGTTWDNLKRAFRKAGMRIHNINKFSKKEWDSWLEAGYFIVAADENTYEESHVLVVRGKLGNEYQILDPNIGIPFNRDKVETIRSARREAFAVCAK